MCNNPNQKVWLICPHCNLDTCDCANCELAKKSERLNKKRECLLFDAISYVANNVDKVEVNCTFHNMLLLREPLFCVNPSLCDEIYDLMEEYGQDHELAEGWWLNYYDEEIVFGKVYDFINY